MGKILKKKWKLLKNKNKRLNLKKDQWKNTMINSKLISR